MRWIGLKFYMESPDMYSNLGLKYHVNRSSQRNSNTGQQRLYGFCYLLPWVSKELKRLIEEKLASWRHLYTS
jgi:hypothetical protein